MKNIKYLLLPFVLFGSVEVDARISILDYCRNGNFDIFLGEAESDPLFSVPAQYSLFWGSTMIFSGLIESLRFKGSVKTSGGIEPIDGIDVLLANLFQSSRVDTLDALTIGKGSEFFKTLQEKDVPSRNEVIRILASLLIKVEFIRIIKNNGLCSTEKLKQCDPFRTAGYENKEQSQQVISAFSDFVYKTFSGTHLAHFFQSNITKHLLNAVADKFQKSHGNEYKDNNVVKRLIDKTPDELRQTGLTELAELADLIELAKSFGQSGITGIASRLERAIDSESEYGYAPETVEKIVLTYISEILQTTDDVISFYKIYSKYRNLIFSPEYNKAKSDSVADKNRAAKLVFDVTSKGKGPYFRPAGTGKCHYLIFVEGEIKKRGDEFDDSDRNSFSDCVETSLRHLFNFVINPAEIRLCTESSTNDANSFSALLRQRVKDAFPEESRLKQDRIDQLEKFYARNQKRLNGQSTSIRDDWNGVVFGFEDENKVIYVRDCNELSTGFDNAAKVICSILGIKYSNLLKLVSGQAASSSSQQPITPTDETIPVFEKLLQILNPTYRYNFSRTPVCKVSPYAKVLHVDVFGDSSKSNCLYKFDLTCTAGHGEFYTLENVVSLSDERYNALGEEEKKLLELFVPEKSNVPYYKIFAMDNSVQKSIVLALKYAANASTEGQRKKFRTIVTNLSDEDLSIEYVDWNRQISGKPGGDNKDIDLSYLSNLKKLRLSETMNVGNLILPDSLEYLRIGRNGDYLGEFKLPKNLKRLEILDRNKIAGELNFPEHFEALEFGNECVFKNKVDFSACKSGHTIQIKGDYTDPNDRKYCIFNQEVVLSKHLTKLDISYCSFCKNVIMPRYEESFSFNSCVFQQKLDFSAATECAGIRLGRSNSYYGGVILPPNLKNLEVKNCTLASTSVELPTSLEVLNAGCALDRFVNVSDFSSFSNLKQLVVGTGTFRSELPPNLELLSVGKNCRFECGFKLPESLKFFETGDGCVFSQKLDLYTSKKLDHFIVGLGSIFSEELRVPRSIKCFGLGSSCKFEKDVDFSELNTKDTFTIGRRSKFSGEIKLPTNLKNVEIKEECYFEKRLEIPQSIESLEIREKCTFESGFNYSSLTNLKQLVTDDNNVIVMAKDVPNLEILNIDNSGRSFNKYKDKWIIQAGDLPTSIKTLVIRKCYEFENDLDLSVLTKLNSFVVKDCRFIGKVTLPSNLDDLKILGECKFENGLVIPKYVHVLEIENACNSWKQFDLGALTDLNQLKLDFRRDDLNLIKPLKTLPNLKALSLTRHCRFKEELELPESLEVLNVEYGCTFSNKLNLGALKNLKELSIYKNFLSEGTVLPASLEVLSIHGSGDSKGIIDVSTLVGLRQLNTNDVNLISNAKTLPNLETLTVNLPSTDIKLEFPKSIKVLKIDGRCNGLDLHTLTNLQELLLRGALSGEVIWPTNLEVLKIEGTVHAGEKGLRLDTLKNLKKLVISSGDYVRDIEMLPNLEELVINLGFSRDGKCSINALNNNLKKVEVSNNSTSTLLSFLEEMTKRIDLKLPSSFYGPLVSRTLDRERTSMIWHNTRSVDGQK